MNDETGECRVKVTDHYYLKARGAFVIGKILAGSFRIGMSVQTQNDDTTLTISGIESLCNTQEKKYSNALVFRERPTLDYLRQAIPAGSVIIAYENSDGQANQAL